MTRWCLFVFLLFAGGGQVFAQSFASDLQRASEIKLLEASREDVERAFGDTSGFYDQESFSREETRILVSYSSGKCTENESYGVEPDDWSVAAGKVATIRIFLKSTVSINKIPLDFSSFRKEALYKGRKDHQIYHDKKAGVAVVTRGDVVDSVLLFPSTAQNSLLCNYEKIRKYYAKKEWKRDPQPEYACVLVSLPPDVVGIDLDHFELRKVNVRVAAKDPENDVLTYVYKVSAGEIVGKGANVVWDLSKEPAGNYSITVAADDGCGICGKYLTRTVTIQ